VSLDVGTPRQRVDVVLDASTNGLLLFSNNSLACNRPTYPCFSPEQSLTFYSNRQASTVSICMDRQCFGDSNAANSSDEIALSPSSLHRMSLAPEGGEAGRSYLAPTQVSLLVLEDFRNVLHPPTPAPTSFPVPPGNPWEGGVGINGIHKINDGGLGGGFFGVNPMSSSSSMLEAIITDERVIALELYPPPPVSRKPSQVHIGGIDKTFEPYLAWTELRRNPVTSHIEFIVEEASVCGAQMSDVKRTTEGVSSEIRAVIDTRSTCLTLPAPIFKIVAAWLPLKCRVGTHNRQHQLPCRLRAGMFPRLPHLSLTLKPPPLSSNDNGGGGDRGGDAPSQQSKKARTLHLDLSDLLMEKVGSETFEELANNSTATYDREVCLTESSRSDVNGDFGPIVIGIRALRSLYVVLDGERARLGLAQRLTNADGVIDMYDEISQGENVQCKSVVPCKGMQTRHADNTCTDPNCSDYFFLELNESDKTCEFRTVFHSLAAAFIIIFVAVEVGLNFCHEQLSKRVRNAVVPVEEARQESSEGGGGISDAAPPLPPSTDSRSVSDEKNLSVGLEDYKSTSELITPTSMLVRDGGGDHKISETKATVAGKDERNNGGGSSLVSFRTSTASNSMIGLSHSIEQMAGAEELENAGL